MILYTMSAWWLKLCLVLVRTIFAYSLSLLSDNLKAIKQENAVATWLTCVCFVGWWYRRLASWTQNSEKQVKFLSSIKYFLSLKDDLLTTPETLWGYHVLALTERKFFYPKPFIMFAQLTSSLFLGFGNGIGISRILWLVIHLNIL